MSEASKLKPIITQNEQSLFPTVDYSKEIEQHGQVQKVEKTVGFFEIEKKLTKLNSGKKIVKGDVIKHEFVESFDGNDFNKRAYSGKTLMISVRTSRFTTSVREATEQDKLDYAKAYELFLNKKQAEEAKEIELNKLKEELANLKASSEKSGKTKGLVKLED